MKPTITLAVACAIVLITSVQQAALAQETPLDLTTLRLEDLMNLDVISVARKPQKLSRAAGAIFIISREDIRRSAATNVPDLLRMVPGLEVAQINPNNWEVSARGFKGQDFTKLLVLVDGRTVYSPLSGGVYWDEQDVALGLIERIEVIRGPGAAVWGLNAVNGIINIILKPAVQTAGGLVTLSAGSQEHIAGTAGYGGTVGRAGNYRLHVDGFQAGSQTTLDHQDGHDDWHRISGDFRLDELYSAQNSLSVEAQAAGGAKGGTANTVVSIVPPITSRLALHGDFSDWNAIARWKHTTAAGSHTLLQTYIDRSNHNSGVFQGKLTTFDMEFQQEAKLLPRQDFVWGLGYRHNADALDPLPNVFFSPAKLDFQIFSAFLQDEISLLNNRLSFNFGARLQHAYYNGFTLQPTAQLSWSADDHSMIWAQISHADRIPSRTETSVHWNLVAFPGPNNLPALAILFGNPKQKNERLDGAQVGVRKELKTFASLDATAYFNQYHDLSSVEMGAPMVESQPPALVAVLAETFSNNASATTHGLEIFGHLKLANRWTLSPGYTYFATHLTSKNPTQSTPTAGQKGQDPTQQAQLRSYVALSSRWQWSTSAYFVGNLTGQAVVPSYTRLDSQIRYRANDHLMLMLVGQNLLRKDHQEYGDSTVNISPNLIRRSAFFRLVWRAQ